MFVGPIEWPVLQSLNPFLPNPFLLESSLAEQQQPATSEEATALLNAALEDLENRGLLRWDRSTNSYDMHPVVRAITSMRQWERTQANPTV